MTVSVGIIAVDAGKGRAEGTEISALKHSGRFQHPISLRDTTRARLMSSVGASGGDREGSHIGTARHLLFANVPVHGLGGTPGDTELKCDRIPEVFFESL